MAPHAAAVVAGGEVGAVIAREGADAEAREHRRVHEPVDDEAFFALIEESRGYEPSFIGVPLYSSEGDRSFDDRAIREAHGVARVFPALVRKALAGFVDVFEAQVAVGVGVIEEPIGGARNVVRKG